jgi:hypothetical protein
MKQEPNDVSDGDAKMKSDIFPERSFEEKVPRECRVVSFLCSLCYRISLKRLRHLISILFWEHQKTGLFFSARETENIHALQRKQCQMLMAVSLQEGSPDVSKKKVSRSTLWCLSNPESTAFSSFKEFRFRSFGILLWDKSSFTFVKSYKGICSKWP